MAQKQCGLVEQGRYVPARNAEVGGTADAAMTEIIFV
jgi:hypothetical protein